MKRRSPADPLGLGDEVTEVEEIHRALERSDQLVGRVLEDIISLLVDRGVIKLSDLPLVARETLEARQRLRARLNVRMAN